MFVQPRGRHPQLDQGDRIAFNVFDDFRIGPLFAQRSDAWQWPTVFAQSFSINPKSRRCIAQGLLDIIAADGCGPERPEKPGASGMVWSDIVNNGDV